MASGGETLFAETLSNDVLLYRLQILICDGGLLVLRNILDQTLAAQGITLRACLDSEKSTVRHLKNRGVITQEQYEILFPDYDQVPYTTDMDITLVICLLRNLKCFGLSQRFDWDATPISSDVSVEADICRLRTLRDKIYRMSTTTRIQPSDFATVWSDIEEVLVRRSSPALNMQQIIADFKKCPLDPEENKRIQKEVKNWKDYEADVGRLDDEMKENVSDVSKNLEETKIPQYQRTSEEPHQVFVITPKGNSVTLNIKSDSTVAYLKALLQDKEHIPTEQQNLMYSWHMLEDGKTLKDYKIHNNCVLHLTHKIRGGGSPHYEKAIELLKYSGLPDQESLNRAFFKYGGKHQIVREMCTKVCTFIQEIQPDVIKCVWPSYRYVNDAALKQYSENDVIFVVVTQSGKKDNIDNSNYNTYIRESSEISQESREVNKLEAENAHYEDKGISRKQKRIVKCMNKNVDNLLEKHSNITTISASLFKSRNFELGEHNLEDNLCIVLYVHVKGYIPLHEEPFDHKIDEYDVDVRECVFSPLMNGPKDFHSILKMGLEIGITSNPDAPGVDGQIGTIGYFEPKYFVTCAHVVMDIAEMINMSEEQTDIKIYQPLVQESRKLCGRVIRAVYRKETGSNNVGVDAALVEIVDREFTPNEFPHSDILGELGLTADLSSILQTGVYFPNHDKNMDIIKYGCASNVTKGGYTLVSHPVVTVYDRIQLRNQITIWPRGKFSHFATGGDSGAVVFEFIDGKLYPTCMIEGTMSDGRAVATPLIDVLVALDIKSPEDVIKLYEDEDGESDMDDSP